MSPLASFSRKAPKEKGSTPKEAHGAHVHQQSTFIETCCFAGVVLFQWLICCSIYVCALVFISGVFLHGQPHLFGFQFAARDC